MRRIAVVVIVAVVLTATSAGAMQAIKKHSSVKHPDVVTSDGPVYEASGPSAYCIEHPSQCKEKHPEDRPVQDPVEHCVDVYGNGDGFTSQWEIANFGERCH